MRIGLGRKIKSMVWDMQMLLSSLDRDVKWVLDLLGVELEHRLGRKGHVGGTAHCMDSQPKGQVWGGIQGTTKGPGTFQDK